MNYSSDAFDLAMLLPEPMILVRTDGEILAANPAAAALLGESHTVSVRDLNEISDDTPEKLSRYLLSCARSRQMTIGSIRLRQSDETIGEHRCEGVVMRPWSETSEAVVLLRLRPKEDSSGRFTLLNRKIDELATEVAERTRAEKVIAGQKQVMEMIIREQPLPIVLDRLARMIEEQSTEGLRVSILLLDRDGIHLRHGAAPSLPEAYTRTIDGITIGPNVGSCGTAAYRRTQVIVSDIEADPLWSDYRDLALRHGLRACWSTPILSTRDEVLGTLAMYYPVPQLPEQHDQNLISVMTRTAAIAIERKRTEESLFEAQRQLAQHTEGLERKIAERTTDLQDTIKSLESFTYSIAHDLRAPLRAMQGFTSILLEDYGPQFDETGRNYAHRISAAAERMDALIQDLLAYGRLSHIDLRPERLDLKKELEDIVARMQDEVTSRRGRIEIEIPLPPILAHSAALAQVLTNLLSNALTFVAPDVLPSIRIYAKRYDGVVRLTVEDNGIGIDETHIQKIFGVFERLHSVNDYPGTGIGLAIVLKGVERMGGRVGVESEPGHGSRFWIELPAADDRLNG